MAKDKRDSDTLDWMDEDLERREREEQAHARRQARKEKLSERQNIEKAPGDRPRAKA